VTIKNTEHCRITLNIRNTEHLAVTVTNVSLSMQCYQYVY